ncbi:MAG: hypothetical protein LW688_09115 [Cryomorphaceae bacterium]|jgi:hypothetical protein|nr:hypothetical protein [Cryomorphaceae bacterium]
MKAELVNLLVSLIIAVVYMIGAIKVIKPFFSKISSPMTTATGVLFLGVVFGFGIILNDFSEIASSAFYYNYQKSELGMGIYYWILFTAISFAFSYAVFHLSFKLIDLVTTENEKTELAKNNFSIAGLHVVVFISICLVVSKPLIAWANGLVNFPVFPD